MSKALTPIEQKQVLFYEDELTAVRADDGRVYVGITEMCNALGIDPQAQRRRIERHAVLAGGYKGVAKLATPGGVQPGYVLRVDLVPLWLSGIRTSAVNETIRPKLERFQQEAAAVLWEAFQEGRLATDPVFSELLERDSEAVEAYKMIAAMLKLARNQVLLESRLDAHHHQIADHEQRLEEIEQQLFPGDPVTQSQAMQISQAVKTVAFALGKKTGRNEHPAIYGELYRRYEIISYKLLPANKFEDAMTWLNEWYQEVAAGTPF